MTGAARVRPGSFTTTAATRIMGAKSADSSHAASLHALVVHAPRSCSSSTTTTTTTTTSTTVPPTPTLAPHAPPVFDWVALDEEKKIWSNFEDNYEDVLVQDLRSDHAGETGAVWIYAGAKVCMEYMREDGTAFLQRERSQFAYLLFIFCFLCAYHFLSLPPPLSLSSTLILSHARLAHT